MHKKIRQIKEKNKLQLHYLNSISDIEIKKQIWELICETDNEFVPPLSYRISTTEKNFTSRAAKKNKPLDYFENLRKQNFIIGTNKIKNLYGFMSFINGFENENIKNFCPCNYISTICVFNKFRGLGLANQLYDFIENSIPRQKILKYITTRTWSKNEIHIRLLYKRKYFLAKKISNARGQGIDTLYFAKKITNGVNI